MSKVRHWLVLKPKRLNAAVLFGDFFSVILSESNIFASVINATLAQSVEQRIRNARVVGSSPMGGSFLLKNEKVLTGLATGSL
jgi:hypothetical protein